VLLPGVSQAQAVGVAETIRLKVQEWADGPTATTVSIGIAGLKEARTAAEVDAALAQPGTTMLVVNSVCGCAAGKMRPAVRLAMQHGTTPSHAITVFAGQDRDATEKARSYFGGHPPSSPAIAILRDGQLVYLMQRSAIETSTAPAIAQELTRAFDAYCATTTA
jgi:putative YphP/YqiW family bacilliredoxin